MRNTHDEIYSMLGLLYEPAQIEQWLDSPQKLLGGAVPRLLMKCDKAQRVKDLLQAILDGAYL